jgi:acetyltransferase-like isoleucine patch superfamily enzyme
VVSANHQVILGEPPFSGPWDESRTGVEVGRNVWVGANCVLLPGTRIGDNSLIAAGSVVNTEVPSGEIWGGTPARRLKAVPTRAELGS